MYARHFFRCGGRRAQTFLSSVIFALLNGGSARSGPPRQTDGQPVTGGQPVFGTLATDERVIWTLWAQGWDTAPPLVGACIRSWEIGNPQWTVRRLDAASVTQWVQLDRHYPTLPPVQSASFSDIVRTELLRAFGGMWVDATVFGVQPIEHWLPVGFNFFACAEREHNYSMPVAGVEFSTDSPVSWLLFARRETYTVIALSNAVRAYWGQPVAAWFKAPSVHGTRDMHMRKRMYFWWYRVYIRAMQDDPQLRQEWAALLTWPVVFPGHAGISRNGYTPLAQPITKPVKEAILRSAFIKLSVHYETVTSQASRLNSSVLMYLLSGRASVDAHRRHTLAAVAGRAAQSKIRAAAYVAAPEIYCSASLVERPRLAIVSHEDFPLTNTGGGSSVDVRSMVLNSRRVYADQHGYSHCASRWKSDLVPTTHVRYVLLYALHHGNEYGIPEFELALWLDFDVVILDPMQPLLHRLGKHLRAVDVVVGMGMNVERPDIAHERQLQLCRMPSATDTSELLRACLAHVKNLTAVRNTNSGLMACFNTGVILTRRSQTVDEWLRLLIDISRGHQNLPHMGARGHRGSMSLFGGWVTDPEAATMAVLQLPAHLQERVRSVSSESVDVFWPHYHEKAFMIHFNEVRGSDKYELLRHFMLAQAGFNKTRLDAHKERFELVKRAWHAHVSALRNSSDRADMYGRMRIRKLKCTAVTCECSGQARSPCSYSELVVPGRTAPLSSALIGQHSADERDDPIPMCSTLPEKRLDALHRSTVHLNRTRQTEAAAPPAGQQGLEPTTPKSSRAAGQHFRRLPFGWGGRGLRIPCWYVPGKWVCGKGQATPTCHRTDGGTSLLIAALDKEIQRVNAMATLAMYPAVLFSCNKTGIEEFLRSSDAVRNGTRRLIIVIVDDYDGPLLSDPVQHVILRASADSRHMEKNEYVLPYLFEPLPAPFPPKPRGEMPVVGFCGQAGGAERKAMLGALEQAGQVNTSFLLRPTFWGGVPGDPQLVAQFRRNMQESHFSIGSRGYGNFAMRTYQTLSAGRIPVLASNTTLLPLAWVVPWHHCIVLKPTPEAVVASIIHIWRHGDIVERQRRCAELHQRYFAPPFDGFAHYMVERLLRSDALAA